MIFLAKHYLFCVYDVLYFFKGILKKIKRLFMICPKIPISTKFLKSNKFQSILQKLYLSLNSRYGIEILVQDNRIFKFLISFEILTYLFYEKHILHHVC